MRRPNQLLLLLAAIFAVWILAAAAPLLRGATYYVDQTAGNDASAGTALAPWKNCPGMNVNAAPIHTGAGVLLAGDTVYLDRSDTWQVSSPLVGGSPDPATQQGTSGGFNLEGGVHYIGDVWDPEGVGAGGTGEARQRAIIQASGVCEAGIVRFDDDDPTIPTWFEGFEVDGNTYFASGVDLNHRTRQVDLLGATKRVQNCFIHDLDGNGGTDTGDGEPISFFSYGITVRSTADHWVANVEILDNIVARPARECIAIYPTDEDAAIVANVIIRGNECYGTKQDDSYNEGHGIVLKGATQNVLVEYNYVHGVNSTAMFIFGFSPADEMDAVIRRNIFQSDDVNGGRGTLRIFETGTKAFAIYGNIFLTPTNTVNPGGAVDLTTNGGVLDLQVYNNTVYTGYFNFAGEGELAGKAIDVRNNLLVYADPAQALQLATGANLTLANNLAVASYAGFRDTGDLPAGFTGSYGLDRRPQPDGLAVDSGAALGAGANLGNAFAGSINSALRLASWDLGAYQTATADTHRLVPIQLR